MRDEPLASTWDKLSPLDRSSNQNGEALGYNSTGEISFRNEDTIKVPIQGGR